MAEECSACGKTGMDLTSIKGDKGNAGNQGNPGTNGINGTNGTNGTNGVDGRAISSVVYSSPNWIVNYSDGGFDVVIGPTVGSFYISWADDISGTGFTLTPTDSLYVGLTDTIAGGTAVVTDFTGKFFRINKPTTRFNNSSFANVAHVTVIADTDEALSSPYILPVIPVGFVSNQFAEFEIEINWTVAPSILSAAQVIRANINGVSVDLGILQVDTQTDVKTVIRMTMVSSTTASGVVTTSVYNPTGSVVTSAQGISQSLNGITINSDVTVTLTDIFSKSGTPTTTIKSVFVSAHNASKTTI